MKLIHKLLNRVIDWARVPYGYSRRPRVQTNDLLGSMESPTMPMVDGTPQITLHKAQNGYILHAMVYRTQRDNDYFYYLVPDTANVMEAVAAFLATHRFSK